MGKARAATVEQSFSMDIAVLAPVVPPRCTLSSVELEVLQWVAHGKGTKEIAELMEGRVTEFMAQNHMNHIMDKIGTSTRAGAVAWGLRNGVIK